MGLIFSRNGRQGSGQQKHAQRGGGAGPAAGGVAGHQGRMTGEECVLPNKLGMAGGQACSSPMGGAGACVCACLYVCVRSVVWV